MLVEARGLRKAYDRGNQNVEALRGVDLTLNRGQFTTIMGPSGSGKSTLLHLMGALDRPSAGSIRIDGKSLERCSDRELSAFRRRKLGFIFQFFNLLPTLTALENVALPLLLDGKSIGQVSKGAQTLLVMMGLGDRMHHRPDQLSGGEMQRVAIARALVTDPLLILADEPTGNLDSKTGSIVLDHLSKLARERGQTILMVTHDPRAAAYGDRLVILKDGQIESDQLVSKPAKVKPRVSQPVPLIRPEWMDAATMTETNLLPHA